MTNAVSLHTHKTQEILYKYTLLEGIVVKMQQVVQSF